MWKDVESMWKVMDSMWNNVESMWKVMDSIVEWCGIHSGMMWNPCGKMWNP